MRFVRLREMLETFACEHTDRWLALPLVPALAAMKRTRAQEQVFARLGVFTSAGTVKQLIDSRIFAVADKRTVTDVEELLLDALDAYLDHAQAHPHEAAPASPSVGGQPPASAAALAGWLNARGLGDRLTDSIAAFDSRVEWLARHHRVATVGEALASSAAPLVAIARAYLELCAERASREAAAARKRESVLSRDVVPELAELDARLELERSARKSRGELRPVGTFEPGAARFEADPARIVYAEPAAGGRSVDLATLDLEGGAMEVRLHNPRRSEVAPLLAAALDAARVLLRSERGAGHSELRTWASMPSWSRTLGAFDAAVNQPVTCTPRSFCIKPRGNGMQVWLGELARTKAGAPTFKQGSVNYVSEELLPEDAAVVRALRRDPYSNQRSSFDEILGALVHHPRVYWENAATRVRVERVAVRFRARREESSLVVDVVLGSGASERVIDAKTAFAALADDRCLVLLDESPHRTVRFASLSKREHAVLDALGRHGHRFPAEAARELLPRLERLGDGVAVEIAGDLGGREVPGDERLVAVLDGSAWPILALSLRVRPLATAAHCVPGFGAPAARGIVDGEPVQAARDLLRERNAAVELASALGLATDEPAVERFEFEIVDLERAVELLGRLRAREGVVVEWVSAPITTRTLLREQLRVRVSNQRDWFAIGGEVQIDGDKLALAVLLEAARKGQKYLQISPGKLVELTDDLRGRLAAVADHAHAARDGSLHITAAAAPAVAALADAPVVAPAFARVLERLSSAAEIEPVVPANLAQTLRPYQREGFEWLMRLASWGAGGVLADDMGLGKTVQAIALLTARASGGPALVVAPTSVTGNWLAELARFAPDLRVFDYRDKRAGSLAKLRAGDVLVASYDLLARDISSFEGVRFATSIIDEAQAVKNATTQRAKAIRALESEVCYALTGTPVENHLGELWSIFSVACPGLLGSWEQFRTRFAQPIEVSGDAAARASLARVIRPFLLRRTKESVAPELPAVTEITRSIELGARERAGYEAMRRAILEQLAGQGDEPSSRFAALAALMRLRRLACHPRLVDGASPVPSAKMQAALEVVEEVLGGGHRALIFSQFTDHLALLRAELDARGVRYLYLDGGTKAAERTRLCASFQAEEAPLFLISLRAGGTGLNLTAADYVMHLDPWWNPAVEDQATDRAHRIGQKRAVTVVRLVGKATIEEAVVSLHAEKRALAEGLLEGTDAAARMSVRQLIDLMKGSDDAPSTAPAKRAPRGAGRATGGAALM